MNDWRDTHSVTCVLCGELADERETQVVTNDEAELGPAMKIENPRLYEVVQDIVQKHGIGEVHQECLDTYMEAYSFNDRRQVWQEVQTNGEGLSVTAYSQDSELEPIVEDEAWWTWSELEQLLEEHHD